MTKPKGNTDIKLSFNLTQDLSDSLDEYCNLTGLSKSKVITYGIKKMLQSSPVEDKEEKTIKALEKKLMKIQKIIDEPLK